MLVRWVGWETCGSLETNPQAKCTAAESPLPEKKEEEREREREREKEIENVLCCLGLMGH
jgi:hypothetical protein